MFRTEKEQEFSSTDPRIVYHVGLMREAGLVRAIVTPKKWKKRFTLAIVKGLNTAGRDFLPRPKTKLSGLEPSGILFGPASFSRFD